MKKLQVFSIIFLANVITIFAQKIKVSESKEDVGGGLHNCIVATIYQMSPLEAENYFRSYMKRYNGTRSIKDGGIFIDNAETKEINGNGTVDVYGKAVGKREDGEIKFLVAFDLGVTFLNSTEHKEQYKAAENLVREFAVKATKKSMENVLKDEQKKYKKLEKAQEELVKNNKKLHDDIEQYKAKIKKAEDDIVLNNADQEKKKTEIQAQKKVVEAAEAKLKMVE